MQVYGIVIRFGHLVQIAAISMPAAFCESIEEPVS